MQNPNQLLEILWNEDAAIGGLNAVALALAAGRRGPWVADTADLALAPDVSGMSIKAVHNVLETAPTGPANFTVAENARSPYETQPINTQIQGEHLYFPGNGIPIPNRATLGINGPNEAAACEHANAIWIDVPGFDNGFNFSAPMAWDEIIVVASTTAARVAVTQSGHTDICGRTIAYTGGQLPIPNDPAITVQVIHASVNDVAGYSGVGLESPGGKGNLTFPCCATYTENYDMMEIFGAYPTCSAATPFNLYGIGVGVAPNTLTNLILGLSGL